MTWQPRIATGLGSTADSGGFEMPHVVRVAASWQTSFLGFKRRQSLQTGVCRWTMETALVPGSFLKAAADAKTLVNIEIAGSSQEVDPAKYESNRAVVRLPLPQSWGLIVGNAPEWQKKVGVAHGAAGCQSRDERAAAVRCFASCTCSGGAIEINAAVPLHKSLEGSAVIDTTSGELLGLLVSLNNRWIIAK